MDTRQINQNDAPPRREEDSFRFSQAARVRRDSTRNAPNLSSHFSLQRTIDPSMLITYQDSSSSHLAKICKVFCFSGYMTSLRCLCPREGQKTLEPRRIFWVRQRCFQGSASLLKSNRDYASGWYCFMVIFVHTGHRRRRRRGQMW